MRRLLLLSAFVATSAAAQTIAITGGTVFPVSGPKIVGGTVVITNGRITAVGTKDRKSTRLNSSHSQQSRMPSSA